MILIEPRQMTKKRRLSFLFCLVVLICAAVRVAHYQMGGDSDSDCVWDEGYLHAQVQHPGYKACCTPISFPPPLSAVHSGKEQAAYQHAIDWPCCATLAHTPFLQHINLYHLVHCSSARPSHGPGMVTNRIAKKNMAIFITSTYCLPASLL